MTRHSSIAVPLAGLLFAVALAGCAGDEPANGGELAGNEPGAGQPEQTLPHSDQHISEIFAKEQTAATVVEISRTTTYVTITVEGQFPVDARYVMDRMDAPAGSIVNISLTNNDPSPGFLSWSRHGFVIRDVADSSPGTPQEGQTFYTEFVAPEEPGEYEFFCPVAFNQERGMVGTFTFT